MIIHYGNGSRKVTTVFDGTGYVCSTIELDGKDVTALLELYDRNPEEFRAWLWQMQGRFPENRPDTSTFLAQK